MQELVHWRKVEENKGIKLGKNNVESQIKLENNKNILIRGRPNSHFDRYKRRSSHPVNAYRCPTSAWYETDVTTVYVTPELGKKKHRAHPYQR